mmetsp:Transcript_107612/g.303037  ORF Transcript_107612/g.303037 Transcript_107612/m.303037 type:complete len:328 (-) Transcript_107612:68-1051(-)
MSSLAMQAVSLHFPDSGAALLEGAASYIVKNTFVDIPSSSDALLDQQPRRRNSSAPPTAMRGDAVSQDDIGRVPEDLVLRSQSLQKNVSTASISTQDDFEDVLSSTGATDAGASDESSDTMSMCAPEFSDATSKASFAKRNTLQLTLLVPPRPTPPPRVALRSRARPWFPPERLSAPSWPTEVRRSFAEVVAAGLMALRSSLFVCKAEVNESADGWSLAGAFQPQHFGAARFALARAQDAMLRAADRSSRVYLVGYKAQPFAIDSSGLGVCAQLAVVEDDESACWDFLAGGHCRRGACCRWRHPSWLVSVDASMRPEPRSVPLWRHG